jgi:hypothetical protein
LVTIEPFTSLLIIKPDSLKSSIEVRDTNG